MIMLNDKKKMSSIILSRMKDGKSQDQEVKASEETPEAHDDLSVAAEEIMQAINDKDVPALKAALKSFFDMCDDAEDEDGEPEASEEDKQPE